MKKKLISVNRLIDRVSKQKNLTKEEKFEKVINTAYKRIYGVKEESWENKFKRADLLTNIVEKDTKDGVYCRIKDVIRFNNLNN